LKQEFILNDDNLDGCHNFIVDIEKHKSGTIEIKIDAFSMLTGCIFHVT